LDVHAACAISRSASLAGTAEKQIGGMSGSRSAKKRLSNVLPYVGCDGPILRHGFRRRQSDDLDDFETKECRYFLADQKIADTKRLMR
jgi:hypothetical protein